MPGPVAQLIRSQQASRPASALTQAATGPDGFLLPHYRTFSSIYNLSSRVYSYRWDEAMRQGRNNAKAMLRDAYLRSLIQERIVPLRRWQWDLEAGVGDEDLINPKDPRSTDREQLRQKLKAIVAKTNRLNKLRRYLGLALWFGRYGSQLAWERRGGQAVVRRHFPVHGDKIQTSWDGYPLVAISPTEAGRFRGDTVVSDFGGTLLKLEREEYRRRFVIHTHEIEDADFFDGDMAGCADGIGLRDFVYWAWWLRDEMLSWLTDFMEKVGNLGLMLFYYEEGNTVSETKAKNAAANVNGRNALAVPIPKGGDKKTAGVELIPANMAGAQFLKEIVGDYFERHIERLFVGQSLTGGSGAGDSLGGEGKSNLAADTKFNLLASDAEDQAETLTDDLVTVARDLNFPGCPYSYRWVNKLPDPQAKDKLEAISKAASLPGKKLTFKASEVRDLTGTTKPGPEDEIVGGDDPQQGMGPLGGTGDGQQPPGGNPGPNPLPQGAPGSNAVPRPDGNGGNRGAGQGAAESRGQAGPLRNDGGGSGGEPGPGVNSPVQTPAPAAPVPGMGELVAAMAQLAEEGDFDGVDELAEIGSDPEGLAGLLEDLEPETSAAQGMIQYQWTAAQTRGGGVKAVWSGDGQRRPLYGERARKALAAQQKGEPIGSSAAWRSSQKKAAAEPERLLSRDVWSKALEMPASMRPEELGSLADHLKRLTRDELRTYAKAIRAKLGGVKADLVNRLVDHVSKGVANGRPGDGSRSGGDVVPSEAAGGGVEEKVGGSGDKTTDRSGGDGDQPAGSGASKNVSRRVADDVQRVHRKIDRFANFFRSKGQHEVASWLDKLRDHVNQNGVEDALAALGEDRGDGPGAQYEGAWATDKVADFVAPYLARNGIQLVNTFDLGRSDDRLVSSLSPSQGASEGRKGDFIPADPTLAHKLDEAKSLPGLESSEDINVLMGKPVTHLTPDVTSRLDETYGKGGWIVKTYGDEAYGGNGIFFPQRAEQIKRDAQNTIWNAGSNLAKYGFELDRDKQGRVNGLKHQNGDRYEFGSKKYDETIGGDARHWGDLAAAASNSEKGAELPFGGKEFMAQPAFPVVGISDADRAAGMTIKPGQEGRVHVITRNGKAELIPHSTWLKQEPLPVVFENDDTRAMAQAAVDAINALPESERAGQIYAPDIVKTANGYKVVEANPANHTGSSGYLGDNPMIMDAYVSHLTGRTPAHVQFARNLLSRKERGAADEAGLGVVRGFGSDHKNKTVEGSAPIPKGGKK